MRIQVERDGGFAYFPGLSGPTTVDTDTLPADEAAALEAAVGRTDFSAEAALPLPAAPCTGLAQTTGDGDDHGRTPGEARRRRGVMHRLGADSRTTLAVALRSSTACSRRRSTGPDRLTPSGGVRYHFPRPEPGLRFSRQQGGRG